MNLEGKNFVLVGGLGGIGLELARVLITKNLANLVILDVLVNDAFIAELQAENPRTAVSYLKFDITNRADIERAIGEVVKKVKYIDVLFNGAGVISDRNVEFTMNVNLIGLINTTLIAMPYMAKNLQGRGGIVASVASVYGLEPYGPISVYVASKHGVIGFARSLADPYYYELTGVASMALCPGLTVTPMTHSIVGKDTFEYSAPLSARFGSALMQSARGCSENLVRAMETNKNGGIFIANEETLKEAEPKVHWEMKFLD